MVLVVWEVASLCQLGSTRARLLAGDASGTAGDAPLQDAKGGGMSPWNHFFLWLYFDSLDHHWRTLTLFDCLWRLEKTIEHLVGKVCLPKHQLRRKAWPILSLPTLAVFFFGGVPVWSCLVSWSLVMFLLFSILVHFVFIDLFWSFHHYSRKALWNGIPGSFAETGLHVWELW